MVSFVILHYNGLSDTKKCIESILNNISHEEISIIVVDNNSIDHGGKILRNEFLGHKNIDVIMNDDNLGFSRGNNIGCEFAKNKYNPDFICVINNDIFIESPNFIKTIFETYNSTNFDVLGPEIWNTKRHFNQNPIQVISTIEEVNQSIKRNNISEKILKSKVPLLYYFYNRFHKSKPRVNKGLHGAALVFSNKYISKYAKVFPEYTFMYGEEDLLYYRKITDNLIFHYEPNLKVFHNHSASTSKMMNNVIGKWRFQHKFMRIALFQLKEIYEKEERI